MGISTRPEENTRIIKKTKDFIVAILCGGPSPERGISLNSARSVVDHLEDENIKIRIFYVNRNLKFFSIDEKQLYSNTPSDFDFKLSSSGDGGLSEGEFLNRLREVDMVFPVIHGYYGEDGGIQQLLEKNHIPFLGCSSKACRSGFDKIEASTILSRNGFYTFPFISFSENVEGNRTILERFFELNRLKKAIVKPANGGSSLGVYCVYSHKEALEKVNLLFEQNNTPVIVEPFCVGREFTIIVIQNSRDRRPIALMPTEIEMKYENYQIFDFRRKYLPTQRIRFYTPARFREEELEKIMRYAEDIFSLLELDDIVRVDGWLLNDGRIWFSDINIVSGMEQNSFTFQQSARVGITHGDFIRHLLASACNRQGIAYPVHAVKKGLKKKVNVLFGGSNAERQISLMSGTNVWLKLLKSEKYSPSPYLLDRNGDIWYLPYSYALNHTVEEIYENLINAKLSSDMTRPMPLDTTRSRLGLGEFRPDIPITYSLSEFMEMSKKEGAFVFLGLHGGVGEDGTLQEQLSRNEILYNGSDQESSRLCMDKLATGNVIDSLRDDVLLALPKIKFRPGDFDNFSMEDYRNFLEGAKNRLGASSFILKPAMDGSSAGVVRICSDDDFKNYLDLLRDGAPFIPVGTFKYQLGIVEMPSDSSQDFLLENFIDVDELIVRDSKIVRHDNGGWLELTVGVLEQDGNYHSLNPSITVAESKILTVEEKFQGGTGVNITPPPTDIIDSKFLDLVKTSVEKASRALGIKNYARLDV
ncbi:MAG: hypothetical protein LBI29_03020, partial [Rickettsiales bacterium]|nr:hypothetical protein [Rickettsiales bacterium]